LTNFNGTVSTPVKKHHLEGSYVVQFDNETITIGDRNYSSYSSTHLMAMPAVLTQIKTRKNAIVEYFDYQIPVTQLMGAKGNGDMQAAKRD